MYIPYEEGSRGWCPRSPCSWWYPLLRLSCYGLLSVIRPWRRLRIVALPSPVCGCRVRLKQTAKNTNKSKIYKWNKWKPSVCVHFLTEASKVTLRARIHNEGGQPCFVVPYHRDGCKLQTTSTEAWAPSIMGAVRWHAVTSMKKMGNDREWFYVASTSLYLVQLKLSECILQVAKT